MKSIFKILVLGVVPILAVTAVVDQGLAADKGSQLIFQSNMAHQNYISVANANDGRAVTVLVQYYNDEMARVLWYLQGYPRWRKRPGRPLRSRDSGHGRGWTMTTWRSRARQQT